MPPRLLLSLLLAALLVSAPGGPDSSVGGTPLDLPGYAALGLVFWALGAVVFFPLHRLPGWWLPGTLLALIALKVIAGTGEVATGFRASYRHGDTKGAMRDARFYGRFASRPYRIDDRIELSPARVDLHFFNDVDLYGYPPYDMTPRETRFPLEITWTGYADDAAADVQWLVSATGTVRVSTPGGEQVLADPNGAAVPFVLSAGQRLLHVSYVKPAGVAPRIRVELRERATGRAVRVFAGPPASDGATRTWLTSAIVWSGLALLIAALGVSGARFGTAAPDGELVVRATGLALTMALMGWAVVLATNAHGQMAFFKPGWDQLYYGSSALDIVHHGPLMLHGEPAGHAAPFYFYPMYPYLLALGHMLIGDNLSSIFMVNGVFVALVPALFLALGWNQLRGAAGVAAFLALGAFIYFYCGFFITFEQPALTDTAYLTFVIAAVLALARACAAPTPARLVIAGILIAFGAATRPSLMTLVYLTPFGLLFALERRAVWPWVSSTLWLAAGVALGLLPFTIRNYLAAGRVVVLVNSWIQIPYFLIPPELPDKPGGFPGLLEAVVMAWGIFLEFPQRTIAVEWRKVLYTLGVTEAGLDGALQANALVFLPFLFTWAVVTKRLPRAPAIALVTFALSHLLAMVVAAPWTFHYKSILPLHAALLFGAAFLLTGRQASAPAAVAAPDHTPA